MSKLSTFQSSLNNFGKDVYEEHGRVLKRMSRSIVTDVIMNTPVDSGRARGNWQLGVNSVPEGETGRLDKDGNVTLNECLSNLSKSRAGDKITITNNVPYIEALENGHSNQAPAGMVALAVEKAKLIG